MTLGGSIHHLFDNVSEAVKCLISGLTGTNGHFSVAEGRLSFIETYRHAYSSTKSISSHIDTGKNAITSGRNAVHEARRNYDCMFFPSSLAICPHI